MKDIYEILKAHGIEVADEFDKKAFEKELFENYKTVAELSKKDQVISQLTDQLNTAKEGLKAFEGVDVNELNGKITKLTKDLEDKETEWQSKVSAMEFDRSIEDAIKEAKGKNAKAIKALLDLDALQKSSNRNEDVKTAIEAVMKDNEYLFDTEGAPSKYASGSGKTGTNGTGKEDPAITAFKKGAGLLKKEE